MRKTRTGRRERIRWTRTRNRERNVKRRGLSNGGAEVVKGEVME